jgi:integrase
MLAKIGISDKIRKKRNIVLHSFRHLLAKNIIEGGINKAIGMKMLGHKTGRIFDLYADHTDKETFYQMAEAIKKISINEVPKEPIPFIRAV